MATKTQMATIAARRMDDTARAMMASGVALTHEQSDEIGDEGGDWLTGRLSLVCETSASGVAYLPCCAICGDDPDATPGPLATYRDQDGHAFVLCDDCAADPPAEVVLTKVLDLG